MSLGSAAHAKFQSWDQILGLNLRCFVKNALSVTIFSSFQLNCVVKEELTVKNGVKKSQKKGLLLDAKQQ